MLLVHAFSGLIIWYWILETEGHMTKQLYDVERCSVSLTMEKPQINNHT